MNHSEIPQSTGLLRDYQQNAKRDILQAWDICNNVMLQMPTGTGKTFLFTSLINDLINYYKTQHQKLTILVVVHRTELLDQIGASLDKYNIPHGFIQGNRDQCLFYRVQVASIQSVLSERNERNVTRLNFDYIIVDEAHHSLAETYVRLFETFPNAKKLGVTATPWRLNHETFLTIYDTLLTTPQISWFIEQGHLADFDYVSIKPDSETQRLVNATEIADTGDFSNADLDNVFNNQRIRAKLFNSYRQFAEGRKGIIYCINKQHAANVAATYRAGGVNAVAIDCDTPKSERQELVEDFKAGRIQVLVNVEIFTEGFDCPDVEFIQLARPTRSLAIYLQQVGRGLRIAAGKQNTIILDNVGLYNYFGLPDANRQWQRHFKGREETDDVNYSGGAGFEAVDREVEAPNYDELDEEMLVVRGAKLIDHSANKGQASVEAKLEPIEFTLVDYYLVYGHRNKFSIYPLVKKRGKPTGDVGRSLFEYESSEHPVCLGMDKRENLYALAQYPKLQTIISFAASMCNLVLPKVVDLSLMRRLTEKPLETPLHLFDLLQGIESIHQKITK